MTFRIPATRADGVARHGLEAACSSRRREGAPNLAQGARVSHDCSVRGGSLALYEVLQEVDRRLCFAGCHSLFCLLRSANEHEFHRTHPTRQSRFPRIHPAPPTRRGRCRRPLRSSRRSRSTPRRPRVRNPSSTSLKSDVGDGSQSGVECGALDPGGRSNGGDRVR